MAGKIKEQVSQIIKELEHFDRSFYVVFFLKLIGVGLIILGSIISLPWLILGSLWGVLVGVSLVALGGIVMVFYKMLFRNPRAYREIRLDQLFLRKPTPIEASLSAYFTLDTFEALYLFYTDRFKELSRRPYAKEAFEYLGINPEDFKASLSSNKPDISFVIEKIYKWFTSTTDVYIGPEYVMAAIMVLVCKEFKNRPMIPKLYVRYHNLFRALGFVKDILNPESIYLSPAGIADSWSSGFTFYTLQLATELVSYLKYSPGIYGIVHLDSINRLIEVLLKQEHPNALLVGDVGNGKTSIVYGLAQRILSATVPDALKDLKIFAVDFNKLLSSVSKVGGLANFLKLWEQELQLSPNAAYFFDDLGVLLSTEANRELLIQILNLLIKYKRPIIATMNTSNFNSFVKQLSALADNFEVIQVPEASKEETYDVLLSKIPFYRDQYKVKVVIPSIYETVRLSAQYMPNVRFPKKAVVVLDKACALAAVENKKVVDKDTILKALEALSGVKIGVAKGEEKRLLNLKQAIYKRYVNQEQAVEEVVEALKRARLGIANKKRPIGVFLFMGPTGVGKTYLAKVVAAEYFGTEHKVIRVDLSQYKLESDIYQILQILSQVRLSPYSLVLLDEFEKAHPSIHDMFLRMFDEGVIKDQNGQDLYFTNSLIVATSNLGSREILSNAGDYTKLKEQLMRLVLEYLKPELVNRFDGVIVFRPLSKEHLKKIADLLLAELAERLKAQGIQLVYSDDLLTRIVESSYDPAMGARPIRRFIETKLKSQIADYVLRFKAENSYVPNVVDLDKLWEKPQS